MTRYHVPHWHQGGVVAFITWRLADSMPAGLMETIRAERKGWLKRHPLPWDADEAREYTRLFTKRVEVQLDAGFGGCILRAPPASTIVEGALRFFNGDRYDLDAFVVMPNHVHILARLNESASLSSVVHSWKSYSAKQICKQTNVVAPVWQAGYWDRLMRSESQLANCRRYIADNPTKARLSADEYRLYVREV